MSGEKTSCTFDISSLQRAIDRLVAQGRKELPEILNQRLLNVAGRALNNTRKASKTDIQAQLGEVGRALKQTKSGKLRRGKRIYASGSSNDAPLAALLINAQRGRAGKPGLFGRQMDAAIRRKVAARKRSVGFNAIGYVPGIRALARTLKKPFIIGKFKGLAIRGEAKGEALPAIGESLAPVAILINRVHSILQVDEGALQQAIDQEAREIQRHLGDDIAPMVDAFNKSK